MNARIEPPLAARWPLWAVAILAAPVMLIAQQREVRQAAIGTGEIAGTVWSADAPRQPVRRAVVSISGTGLPDVRSAITDDAGKFALGQLSAGTFTVTVRKAGYLEAKYNATRPGRSGSPIALAAGQHVTIDITIFKGAAISGFLRDAAGMPLAGIPVVAAEIRDEATSAALLESLTFTTDDRGAYRIYGLKPGEYVVAATPPNIGSGELTAMSTADMDALLANLARRKNASPPTAIAAAPASRPADTPPVGFAPIYFPGTADYSAATRVRLQLGEEREGVSFEVSHVPLVSIDGVMIGEPNLSEVEFSIVLPGPRLPGISATRGISRKMSSEPGAFVYTNVPPGQYRIVARARRIPPDAAPKIAEIRAGGTPGGDDLRYAVADVDVRGQDVNGIVLPMQPGGTLTGKVAFDAATAAIPRDLSVITIGLSQTVTAATAFMNGVRVGMSSASLQPVKLAADGTFRLAGIGPASYTFNVALPADLRQIWRMRSAVVDGRDLLDETIDGPSIHLAGVTVTFTDRRTELAGTLQSASGQPTGDYFIIVFSQDRRHWRAGARRSRSTRPATDGRFLFDDLPPGEYFLAALTDLDPAWWQDAGFLEQASGAAIKLTVIEGQKTVQDVRIR